MGKVVLRDAIARVGGRRSDGQVSIEVAIWIIQLRLTKAKIKRV